MVSISEAQANRAALANGEGLPDVRLTRSARIKEPEAGGNLTELKADIKTAVDQIVSLKADRSAISAEIGGIKAGLATKGIPRRSLNRAIQDWEALQTEQPDETTNASTVDEAYIIAREALLIPIQLGLFD